MPAMSDLDLNLALDTAIRCVEAASAASMKYFRADVPIEVKPDRSPVTRADKEAEAAILSIIRNVFPSHSILAEESGISTGAAETRWIVDPLDGTRGFTRGGTFWGPLIALEHKGEIVAGAMGMPANKEMYWGARGLGAYRDGVKLKVSSVSKWEDATVSVGELSRMLSLPIAKGCVELLRTCASVRGYGDVASATMLLNGRADVWIEGAVQIWDLAPMQIIVEEAGGKFTDYEGKAHPASGNAIVSNGLLHDHVLKGLQAV
jgi:histidinol-phosphatase